MSNKTETQQEIINSLTVPCHGLLNIAPRVGKTRLVIELIKLQKPKSILWVTPNTKLRDIDIPTEFVTWSAKDYLKKTKIICYASLSKIQDNYELIVLDEYQHLSELNAASLISKSINYNNIVGLSGTHPKNVNKQNLYNKLNLKILSSMNIDTAVDKNLIAPYNITVIECRLDNVNKNIISGNKDKPFYQTEQAKYDYLTQAVNKSLYSKQETSKFTFLARLRFIYGLPSKHQFAKRFIKQLKGRTLVFAGTIAQAEDLAEHTYHSKTTDKSLLLFLENKINTLCCVNAGGTGFTYKNVDNFVITQVNSDVTGSVTQKIARSLVLQKNYKANIYILCAINTVDENWKNKVLENFDTKNITHVSYKNYPC